VIPSPRKSDILEGSAAYSTPVITPVRGPQPRSSNRAFIAIGVFCYFAMTMALYAAITLLHPGTALDRLWSLNPDAYRDLLPICKPAGVMFLLIATTAAITGYGWLRRRIWGWRLAVLGIGTQVLGDCVNLIRGDLLRGGAGLLIGGGLLIYLLSSNIKNNFTPVTDSGPSADQKAAH